MFGKMFFFILTVVLLADKLTAEQCFNAKYEPFKKDHTACLTKSKYAESQDMTNWRQKILDSHNTKRAKEGATNMMKMTWDDELEMLAGKWADACEVRGSENRGGLRHDDMRFIPGGMDVGQNMASGTLNFTKVINAWWNEKDNYMMGVSFMVQSIWGIMIGHYTQMSWAVTYKIGCAATKCTHTQQDQKIIVCNYGPAGNKIPFNAPYEAGTPCSKCKTCSQGGLCDCGDIHCNGGTVIEEHCTCNCTIDGKVESFMPEPDCKLTCEGTTDYKYCGMGPFTDCSRSFIVQKCPHMCNVCPK